jgi:hypothetical protein
MISQFKDHHGYSAFALYNSLKLHFSSPSYDYFKYHGKTNVSESSFMKRKDKYSFYKLSRKYNLEELKNYYISNFLEGDVKWVGAISGLEGEETYKKWQSRNQRLTYQFEQDIIYLFNKYELKDILSVSGSYPKLLEEMMQENVMIETVVILNDMMNFFPMWQKKISDDIIWPNWKLKLEKYAPFLYYDKAKFKAIVKDKMNENQ